MPQDIKQVNISIDISNELPQLNHNSHRQAVADMVSDIRWVSAPKLEQTLQELSLPMKVWGSSALRLLKKHFEELAKNSIDAVLAGIYRQRLSSEVIDLNCQPETGDVSTEVVISIKFLWDDSYLEITYQDNGTGFEGLEKTEEDESQLYFYRATKYGQECFHSPKISPENYFLGGRACGLKMLARDLEARGGCLKIGNSNGALLRWRTDLSPYCSIFPPPLKKARLAEGVPVSPLSLSPEHSDVDRENNREPRETKERVMQFSRKRRRDKPRRDLFSREHQTILGILKNNTSLSTRPIEESEGGALGDKPASGNPNLTISITPDNTEEEIMVTPLASRLFTDFRSQNTPEEMDLEENRRGPAPHVFFPSPLISCNRNDQDNTNLVSLLDLSSGMGG